MFGPSYLIDLNWLKEDFFEMLTVPLIVKGTLVVFLIIYVLGWLRGLRGEKDPLLGGKVIFGMVFTVGFQIVLIGVALWMPAIMENNSGDLNGQYLMDSEEQIKPLAEPLAVLVAGMVIGIYGLGMTYGLSRHRVGDSQVLRQSLGLNAIITIMISGLWLLDWCLVVFKEGFDFETQVRSIWIIVVYAIGHIFCVLPVIRMIGEAPQGAEAAGVPEAEPATEPASPEPDTSAEEATSSEESSSSSESD